MRTYRQKPATLPAYRMSETVTEQDIQALRAMDAGQASPDQQRLALRLVLVKVCGIYDQDAVFGHPDQTFFRSGRAFIGRTLMKFLRADLTQLLGEPHEE